LAGRVVVEPEGRAGCRGDLAGAPGRVVSSVQVFDIPSAALTVTEYQMMRRTCGCGPVTAAAAPPGVTGGPACYGPGVDAATLLAGTDVMSPWQKSSPAPAGLTSSAPST
jgi:hypothetical protein